MDLLLDFDDDSLNKASCLHRNDAKPVDIKVGENLRVLRLQRGYSQKHLADALGIRFQQIQKYESAANRISASRLWQISQVLDVPISYFFLGTCEREEGVERIRAEIREAELLLAQYRRLSKKSRVQMMRFLRVVGN